MTRKRAGGREGKRTDTAVDECRNEMMVDRVARYFVFWFEEVEPELLKPCLLYTSDAADE